MKKPKQRLRCILTIGLIGVLCLTGILTKPEKTCATTESIKKELPPIVIKYMPVQTVSLSDTKTEVTMASEGEVVEVTIDRTQPIYEVYKDGHEVEVAADLQWLIRDFATEYEFDEEIIFGLALAESTFNSKASSEGGKVRGLFQINKFWIGGARIPHFTDTYKSRDLFNPADSLITLAEMWSYAIDSYDIDISTEQGMKDLLYWHNTGRYKKDIDWKYSNRVFKYANELVEITY